MKRPIAATHTFSPDAGTLDLSGIAGFDITKLFAVIDLRTGALVYAPTPGCGVSAVNGTVLTLQASMAGMLAADPLMILYDDGGKPAEDASLQAVLAALLAPATPYVDRSGVTGAAGAWTSPFAANPARRLARITNTSGVVIYVWDKTGAPVQANAFPLQPGEPLFLDSPPPSNAIQVMSLTAGATFEATEG